MIKKYLPFILMDIKGIRRIYLLFEMLFWPLITLSSFGLFTVFTNASGLLKMFLFTGVIGWSIIQICQHAIGRGFLIQVWDRVLKQTFSAPIKLRDFVVGHWLYGIIASTVSFLVMAIVATAFFNFNILSLGLYIPVVIILASLSAFIIGVTAISLVLLFGLRIDFIVWTIVDMVVFISGVYYSITVFPEPVQTISHFFPVIYVFEGMREFFQGIVPLQTFAKGYLVAFAWIAIMGFVINKIENYARKSGFYQRYG